MSEAVNHPAHYGGEDNPYEAIKVIEAWDLTFALGNTVKYVARSGKKNMPTYNHSRGDSEVTPCRMCADLQHSRLIDLEKAAWYLAREIANERRRLEALRAGREKA